MKKIFTIIAILFCQMAFGQAPFFNGTQPETGTDIAFADLSVDTLPPTITKGRITLKKRISCTDIGNASSRGFRAIVLLPGEAKIISYAATNTSNGRPVQITRVWIQHPTNLNNKTGYLLVSVKGDFLDKCEYFDLTVETSLTKPEANNYGNFAVFAYSLTPECKPQDNYWFWKKQPQISGCKKENLPKRKQ